MGQVATTIEEQIQIYRDRGMLVENEEKAKAILLDVGFYRLSFYCFPFEKTYPNKGKDRKKVYEKGTRFQDVVDLYNFDLKLTSKLMDALTRIEVSFRTKLVHEGSNAYKPNGIWFANPLIVTKKWLDEFSQSTYPLIRKREPSIEEHHKKYPSDRHAPAWKTLEYMTFGDTARLYENLLDADVKRKVAQHFGVNNLAEMVFLLKVMRELRNTCAHSKVLFDKRSRYRKQNSVVFQGKKTSPVMDLGNMIEVVAYFLGKISPDAARELREAIAALFGGEMDNPKVYSVLKKCTGYSL